MKIRVDVNLKAGVLDPQGQAIAKALAGQGFNGIEEVRVGKTIELVTNHIDAAKAKAEAEAMAQQLLANLVIEDYKITVAA